MKTTVFRKENISALVIVVLGAVFVGIGIARGEAQDVYVKAVNICLECIGIG